MSDSSLSIIVPAYNYAHTLPRAISSIACQTMLPDEVLVIDDGSKDNTAEVMRSLSEQHPQLGIRYVHQQNQGPSRARNHGIELAQSDFIMLLDADDELLPDAVKVLTQKAAEEQADLVIGGSIAVSDDRGEKEKKADQFSNDPEENFRNFLEKESSISHGRFIARRSLFQTVRYPESLRGAEDLVVYGQLMALCNITTVLQPVVKIYHHGDSLRHNVKHATASGLQVVDYLFADPLPQEFMKYRSQFYTRRCLSLFRTIYLGGDYSAAKKFYLLAIKNDRKALFKWSYLKKYIKCLFRKSVDQTN